MDGTSGSCTRASQKPPQAAWHVNTSTALHGCPPAASLLHNVPTSLPPLHHELCQPPHLVLAWASTRQLPMPCCPFPEARAEGVRWRRTRQPGYFNCSCRHSNRGSGGWVGAQGLHLNLLCAACSPHIWTAMGYYNNTSTCIAFFSSDNPKAPYKFGQALFSPFQWWNKGARGATWIAQLPSETVEESGIKVCWGVWCTRIFIYKDCNSQIWLKSQGKGI